MVRAKAMKTKEIKSMFSRRIAMTACLLALIAMAVAPAFGASGDKVKNKGVITLRTGDTLTVKTSEGVVMVSINSDTKIQHGVGLTGVRKKQDTPDVLIPGLKMKFEGVAGDQENQVIAKTIDFDEDDLSIAEVIQAGLNPVAQEQARHAQAIQANQAANQANAAAIAATNEEVAATKQEVATNKSQIDEVASSTKKRFSEIGEFVTKAQYTVLFGTGQYGLTSEYKQGLADLAKQALTYSKGWVISVAGYADSVGTASSNQVLSKQRAQAVVAYLLQDCGVPVGRIVAPGAMGETNPVASNESASGRADNRRVDVKLLLNKGVAAGGM
jgi:outer membrane protein OmpA-like peptidoglycan-associated protein